MPAKFEEATFSHRTASRIDELSIIIMESDKYYITRIMNDDNYAVHVHAIRNILRFLVAFIFSLFASSRLQLLNLS